MERVLGQGNYPYFSGAIGLLLMETYFRLHVACGAVALLHWGAERFYLGRSARKYALGMVVSLLAIGLLGGFWVHPRLKVLHVRAHAVNLQPAEREAAARAVRFWQTVSQMANLVVVGGLVVYVWRVSTAVDSPRFVSSVQLRVDKK